MSDLAALAAKYGGQADAANTADLSALAAKHGALPPKPPGQGLDDVPGIEHAVRAPAAPEPGMLDKIRNAGNTLGGLVQNSVAYPLALAASVPKAALSGQSLSDAFGDSMQTLGRTPATPTEASYSQTAADALTPLAGLTGMAPGRTGVPVKPAIGLEAQLAADALAPVGRTVKNVAGKVAAGTGKAAQEVAGFTTGTGAEAMKQAYKAGREGNPDFAANMRGQAPVEEVLAKAKQGLQNMQNEASQAYSTAKTGWAADKTGLDFKPIDAAFNRLQDTLQVNGHRMVGDGEAKIIGQVSDVLDEWRADPASHTTVGLDALKRRLDAIYPDSPTQTQAQRVITGTRNAVKDAIVKQAPDYAEAMKAYEEQAGAIRDIDASFSTGNRASKDTAIRKLQSLMRNNVQANYGFRQQMAKSLEEQGGVDLMAPLAGQALNSWMPRGLARAGGIYAPIAMMNSPMAMALAPAASPRIMGELFHGAGRGVSRAKAMADALLSEGNP